MFNRHVIPNGFGKIATSPQGGGDFGLTPYTVTLKLVFGPLKVIESGTMIQHIGYDFIFHSNYASIHYRFRDIAAYWSKIATPLVFGALVGGEAVMQI